MTLTLLVGLAVVLVATGCGGGSSSTTSHPASSTPTTSIAKLGHDVFVGEGGCASCHTLAAAGAHG